MLTGIRMQRGGLLRFVPLAGAPWSRLPLPEELEPLTVPADQGYGAGAGKNVVSVSFYRLPPGRQDEWLALYKKYHYPIMQWEKDCHLSLVG
jgi:hypothetical protein